MELEKIAFSDAASQIGVICSLSSVEFFGGTGVLLAMVISKNVESESLEEVK